MMSHRLIPVLVALALAGRAGAEPPRLLVEAAGPAAGDARPVSAALDLLDPAGVPGALRLAVPGGGDGIARLEETERRGPRSLTWRGRLVDDPDSLVTVVAHRGALAASVRTGDGRSLQVRVPAGGRTGVAYEAAAPDVPDCVLVAPPEVAGPRAAAMAAAATGPGGDDGSTVDVLVAYTTAARIAQGGTAAMEALIQLAVAETNAAYQASFVTHRLFLVHTVETVYAESGNGTLDLSRLTSPTDGIMDEVNVLRDDHRADVVSLIVSSLSTCGTGWLVDSLDPSEQAFAYNVVLRSCAVDNLSFAHEVTHNMGGGHDRTNGLQGIFPYSYGVVDLFGGFRTIMAQGSPARIPRFSNPDVLFGGRPTGYPEGHPQAADHARTVDETALLVSNFRVRQPPCPADTSVPEDGVVDVADLLEVLADWGATGGFSDVNGDGIVDVTDLLTVLADWGPCGG
ncbi:MAG: reprolysin-like metallopeptidase [Planctomycetota bacterium]